MFRTPLLVAAILISSASLALSQAVPLPEPRPLNGALPAETSTEASIANPESEPLQLAGTPGFVQPQGQSTPPSQLSQEQLQAVQGVNDYFNSVQVLSGDFIQQASNGARSEGKFFLKKPGKLRFEFDPPSRLQIIADGKSVAVRDRKLATQDIYPLSQTPLRYLLQSNINLLRDTKVLGVTVEPGLVSLEIEETNKVAGTSKLVLVFGGPKLELKQWTVTDPQGMETMVAVYNLDGSSAPDERLFAIDYTIDPANRR